MTNPRQRRNDLLLIAALVLLAVLGGLCLLFLRGPGDAVEVTVNGERYGVYSLQQNHTADIRTGPNGQQQNRLVIRDGKAFIETATCPDGICAAHRAVHRQGESIVCLPHRVVVTVIAAAEADGPDVVI